LTAVHYPIENALFQWEEGWRRLQELRSEPGAYRRADRIVGAIRDELRRRIGPTFRAVELADLYAEGTDWCLEVVLAIGLQAPLEPQQLADAAFWLYLRGASDFAGGRQLAAD
jgi:hypothetical protein